MPVMSDETPIAGAEARPTGRSDDLDSAYTLLATRFPDENFSRDFILGSTRTRKLQAGLLASLVAIFIVIIAHEIISAQRTSGQVATTRVNIPPELSPESATVFVHSRTVLADTAVRPQPSLADDPVRFVREVQRELKRVGCYSQDIDGEWRPATRRAMKDFTDRANAVLPLDRPDPVLLALLQSQTSVLCGNTCPAGQDLTKDNRCLPSALPATSPPSMATQSTVLRTSTKVARRVPKRSDTFGSGIFGLFGW
jgi:hypothetical protein